MHRIAAFFCLAVFPLYVFADSPGPHENPNREYPPSCLGSLLDQAPSGPLLTTRVPLLTKNADDLYTGFTEEVNLVLWRTPCDRNTSALLGALVRDPSLRDTIPVPTIPNFLGSQGTAQDVFLRIALDANTTMSFLGPGGPLPDSTIFVFEEGRLNGTFYLFDYSGALSITVASGSNVETFSLNPYDPSQYPTALQPLQISGYQTGNYADPTAGGQGVQVEVAEAGQGQRAIVLAWYTYDASGTSYWLFNSENFTPGARSVSLPLGYFSGGAFVAGNGVPALWGDVSVSFPDCDHMILSYQSAAGLPNGTPQGSGTRIFTRATSINGVSCN